jgi:uncharacterized membrane protein YecN with MAPEG domain
LVYLSVRVIGLRRSLKISIGTGAQNPSQNEGASPILRATRAQANFSEYVPLALLLMALLEIQGVHYAWLHALGICLLCGRCIHAYGISHANERFIFRVSGMVMTFAAILTAAFLLLLCFMQRS